MRKASQGNLLSAQFRRLWWNRWDIDTLTSLSHVAFWLRFLLANCKVKPCGDAQLAAKSAIRIFVVEENTAVILCTENKGLFKILFVFFPKYPHFGHWPNRIRRRYSRGQGQRGHDELEDMKTQPSWIHNLNVFSRRQYPSYRTCMHELLAFKVRKIPLIIGAL